MEEFRLKLFFWELIKLGIKFPGRPGFGSPVSWLLEQMCIYNKKLIDRIRGDYSNESHECRLNDAGLKMHWRVDRANSRFVCYISGDQAKDYPEFCKAAGDLIRYYNFDKREGGV